MKIFEYIPQLGSGGGERFTVDLCNELSNHHEVVLCVSYSLEKLGFYKDEISPNVRVICMDKKKGFDFLLPFRIYNLIRKEKPDVVHTHLMAIVYSIFAILFFRKAKYFHTVHNSAKEETDGKIGEIIRRFLFSYRLAKPVTISPVSQNSFHDFYGLKAPMIYNGRNIPSTLEISESVQKEFNIFRHTDKTRVIVQLAHIGHQKRQDVMARVVDRLTKEGYELEVLMIGEVIVKDMVDDINSLNNQHIHLLGGKHNPLEYLKLSDAFGLTSSYEGLPISLIEALGVGIIPICTPVGGIVDLINNGVNGFLSKDISEDSYYEAMKSFLLLSFEQMQRMKQNALNSYTPFSMTDCAKKYESLFLE